MIFLNLIVGRFELLQYCEVCRSCGNQENPFYLERILNSGFWPQSPDSFNYIFKKDVFVLWDQFRKQMPGSSELAFLETLNSFTRSNGRVGRYRIVFYRLPVLNSFDIKSYISTQFMNSPRS